MSTRIHTVSILDVPLVDAPSPPRSMTPSESAIGQAGSVDLGDRMLLWCDGGPSIGRATTYPPPLEIAVDGGMYVLVDVGPVEEWHYSFVEESQLRRSSSEPEPAVLTRPRWMR